MRKPQWLKRQTTICHNLSGASIWQKTVWWKVFCCIFKKDRHVTGNHTDAVIEFAHYWLVFFSTTFMCYLLISPCPHPVLYQNLCPKASLSFLGSISKITFLFIFVIWPSVVPRTILSKTQTKKLFSLCSTNVSVPKRTRREGWWWWSLSPVSLRHSSDFYGAHLPPLTLSFGSHLASSGPHYLQGPSALTEVWLNPMFNLKSCLISNLH